MNRRFEVSIEVFYRNGLSNKETHPAQGLNHVEAENDLLTRRDTSPDAEFHDHVELRGWVEIRDGVYGGAA